VKLNKFLFFNGLLISAILILLSATGDLGLDEVWSIYFAENAKSFLDVFHSFKHDNNHLLNTFYLYLLGQQDILFLYRLLSCLAAISTIFILSLIAKRWGNFEKIAAVYLAGLSYPLLLYCSEARGYSLAILFSVLSFKLLLDNWQKPKLYRLILFWIVTLLGFLSHLTFIIVFISLLTISVVKGAKQKNPFLNKIRNISKYYLVPGLFFVFLYLFFIREMKVGGGHIVGKLEEVCRAILLAFGFYPTGNTQLHTGLYIASAIVYLVILAVGVSIFYRRKQIEWVFFLMVLLFAPLLVILVRQPKYLYFRYFIICFPFFYLLLSRIAGLLYRKYSQKPAIAVILIIALVLCHSERVYSLLVFKRGHYRKAIEDIVAVSNKDTITISSDQNLRHRLLIDFYARFLPTLKKIQYIRNEDIKHHLPDWMIFDGPSNSVHWPKILVLGNKQQNRGYIYRLLRPYGIYSVAGWLWLPYRREAMVDNLDKIQDQIDSEFNSDLRLRLSN